MEFCRGICKKERSVGHYIMHYVEFVLYLILILILLIIIKRKLSVFSMFPREGREKNNRSGMMSIRREEQGNDHNGTVWETSLFWLYLMLLVTSTVSLLLKILFTRDISDILSPVCFVNTQDSPAVYSSYLLLTCKIADWCCAKDNTSPRFHHPSIVVLVFFRSFLCICTPLENHQLLVYWIRTKTNSYEETKELQFLTWWEEITSFPVSIFVDVLTHTKQFSHTSWS